MRADFAYLPATAPLGVGCGAAESILLLVILPR
jgi:hypothetical protein